MDSIPFHKCDYLLNAQEALQSTLELDKASGDGPWTQKCRKRLEDLYRTPVLLTPSCTAALEMSAFLSDIKEGDEVILPSFTFSSTASAFALRGARLIFVDVEPKTLNVSPAAVESAITKNTRAIICMHYGSVSCDMAALVKISKDAHCILVEDAAQCIGASYKDTPLGSIGDFGTLSFHATKNLGCGEGGALILGNPKHLERAEMIREKGTNRSQFLRGEVDKYTWRDIGSSYLPSEFQMAVLDSQLDYLEQITAGRLRAWSAYKEFFSTFKFKNRITLTELPEYAKHNAHLFSLRLESEALRDQLREHLLENNIQSVTHYVPLHSSPAGMKYGEFRGEDRYTTSESSKLLRLPLFATLTDSNIEKVCHTVESFFEKN